jgi:hypothetical protein
MGGDDIAMHDACNRTEDRTMANLYGLVAV